MCRPFWYGGEGCEAAVSSRALASRFVGPQYSAGRSSVFTRGLDRVFAERVLLFRTARCSGPPRILGQQNDSQESMHWLQCHSRRQHAMPIFGS